MERVSRLPSLDGWRAFSILHVLGAHSTITVGFPSRLAPLFRWVFDGELGVRTFFLISGFLITWLLLVEDNTFGSINLPSFYARRCLRILPVYIAFLAVLVGLTTFTPYRQATSAWIGNATFTTNFVSQTNWTSGHLWSLAVEEQFYLLWPGLFMLSGVARNSRAALWVLAVPVVLAPVSRVVSYLNVAPPPLRFLFGPSSFFNFFDSLAIGCLCAVLYSRRRDRLSFCLTGRPITIAVAAVMLILIPHTLNRWLILGVVTVPFGNTLQGLGMATLLLQSLMAPTYWPYRLLNNPLVSRLGVLSYSIYIWQQIFSTRPEVFGLEHVWWMSFPGWLVSVLAVSLISYYGLERPFLKLRARFRYVSATDRSLVPARSS